MDSCLEQFLGFLEAEKNASPLTLQSYRNDVCQFLTLLEGGASLFATNHHSLRRFLAWLKEAGYTRSSVARKLSAVRSFLYFLQSRGLLNSGNWSAVSRPRQEKKLPHFLYYHEVAALMSAPECGTVLGYRDRTILEMLYAGGFRVSELVAWILNRAGWRVLVWGSGAKEARKGSCPWGWVKVAFLEYL